MKLPHKQSQEYLLTWYKDELTYIRDFRVWQSKPQLDWGYRNGFTEALYYFEVPCWDDPEQVGSLMSHTFDYVHSPTPRNVDAFALKLAGLFDDNPTSLASKLLFLSNPQKITPTSASVRAAVGLRVDTYRLYRLRFAQFREKHQEEIRDNLRKMDLDLSQIEKKFDEIPRLQEVRINRYTDQLLRLMGHQILDRSAVSVQQTGERSDRETTTDYVKPATIGDLRGRKPRRFDTTELVRLCEELNLCYADGRAPAVEMIVRSIQENVRPIFKVAKFSDILSEYQEGSPAFRRSIIHLVRSQRPIANYWLHGEPHPKESRAISSDVNFIPDVNVLLEEVVKILKP